MVLECYRSLPVYFFGVSTGVLGSVVGLILSNWLLKKGWK